MSTNRNAWERMSREKNIWNDGGCKPEKRIRGIRIGSYSKGPGEPVRWRIVNTLSGGKRMETFPSRLAAVQRYDEIASLVEQEGRSFQLTPTERAAIVAWRAHRQARLMAGKDSLTLDKAIHHVISWEEKQDEARPTVGEMFLKFASHKEKEARGRNSERAMENVSRELREIETMIALLGQNVRVSIFDDDTALRKIEERLHDSIVGRNGGYPSKTTIARYRRHLNVFLNWLVKRGVIARNPSDLLPDIQEGEPPREVYSPEELASILATAQRLRADAVPWLVLGAFCGIRPRELSRLSWEDIDMKGNLVKVHHGKSKTGRARFVPLPDVCKQWLEWAMKEGIPSVGHIVLGDTPQRREWTQRRAIDALKGDGVEWKHDALRHSFASYACALYEDYPRVAAWLGNSVAVMEKHYRQARRKDEAEAWFNVYPEKEENDKA